MKGAGRRSSRGGLPAEGAGGSDQTLSKDVCVTWVFTGELVCFSRPTRGVPASCTDEEGALPGPTAAPGRGPGRGEEWAQGRVRPVGVSAGLGVPVTRQPPTDVLGLRWAMCAGRSGGAVTMRCGCAPQDPKPGRPPSGQDQAGGQGLAGLPRGRGSGSFQGSTKPGPGCLLPSEVELGVRVHPGTHTPPRLSLMCGVKWGETLGPV